MEMDNPGFERAGSARLAVGTILNHTFQIRRFVARGGMGEVYEGVNLTTDEHVAIKVISPHLAEDQQVEALFRREARVLPRLVHPALAQYRLMTKEPDLGLLYIATEFVDGPSLEALIGELKLSDDELLALLERLAEGLKAAHDLGAIHRDLSPDNILLGGGRPADAKIIDFGIVRDLASTKSSIIGEGFAGKLAFAAPEQFGDFDRQIGAWTDVYSLGPILPL
jgi:serine/threonine protein kinase